MPGTVKDSSIWSDPGNLTAVNRLDGLIRIGIVKGAFNDTDTGELRYLVEIQDQAKKINVNCRMMRRFGGVYNYEDYIDRGYNINDFPDPVSGFSAKAGDAVLVGQLNGQGREGVILGGLTHAARTTTIQATNGPQYDAEFNGIHTNINQNGEWTLTFKGQPTNLSGLNNVPSGAIPAPQYNTTIGSSFMKFDVTGSYTVSDNATNNPQSVFIDKPNGVLTITAGPVSMVMDKNAQSMVLTCEVYKLEASATAIVNSPKVAIGNGTIELLDQLTQLIDALGKVTTISPVGPCTSLNEVEDWPVVEQIKANINKIKGTLS
jgi:hypothetical protein